MKHPFNPQTLPVAAFANDAGHHSGTEPLARFSRLMEEAAGFGGETPVHYTVQGALRTDAAGADEPWLQLGAHTSLRLTCQRCLAAVDVPVAFDRAFRFVATEELAAVEDEESEEDVLVLAKSFNLLELIEDELLMALPPVPKHEVCPQSLKLSVADPDFVDEAAKPNPFAVLGQLKKS